jgi:hypothetical protein
MMGWLGYFWIAVFVFAVFVPGLVMNYIKEQIKNGEWVDTQPLVTSVTKDEPAQIDERLMLV